MKDYHPTPDLLKDRIILITGAGDGIGKAAAKSFAAHGATVVLLGRTIPKLEAVYDEIESSGQCRTFSLRLLSHACSPETSVKRGVTVIPSSSPSMYGNS